MENAEEVFQFLEDFSKRKPKIIPQELNDYLIYVARTGDPVYQWSLVKSLFKEKLLNVITDFHESTPSVDIPPCPNVDPFNYDIMKNSLIERLDSFSSAPFTVQRICELLTCPRKQYNRVDKFMRAIEKNILVVSTREPGSQRHQEPENGEPMEPMVNGSDNNSEYNVDVEMEDISWKETGESHNEPEPQPSSSDAHITVDDIEARLQAKQNESVGHDKKPTEYESVTPPELNVVESTESPSQEDKPSETETPSPTTTEKENNTVIVGEKSHEQKIDEDMKESEPCAPRSLIIPDIKVDNAEMTEQKLQEQAQSTENIVLSVEKKDPIVVSTVIDEKSTDESSSDASIKDDNEPKNISEASSSSEESSSSSDNVDGNSSSPNAQIEIATEKHELNNDSEIKENENKPIEVTAEPSVTIESENYSITDVSSELPQASVDDSKAKEEISEKPSEETQEIQKNEISMEVTTSTENTS